MLQMKCCGVDSASNWRDLIQEDFGLEDEDGNFSNKTNVPSGCCHWQKNKINDEFESIFNDTVKVRVNIA